MLPAQLIYLINAALLIAILIIAVIMTRAGTTFTWNIGDQQVQTRMKWRIIRAIMALVVIGITAAIINIISAQV